MPLSLMHFMPSEGEDAQLGELFSILKDSFASDGAIARILVSSLPSCAHKSVAGSLTMKHDYEELKSAQLKLCGERQRYHLPPLC